MNEHPADCGLTYTHELHLYRTPSGKIRVCDGNTNKRTREKG